MSRELLQHTRTRIIDRLSYLLLFAPDFPAEDETSLEREHDELQLELHDYETAFPKAKEHPLYALVLHELESAFALYRDGDTWAASKQIQVASERFKQTFHGSRPRVHFVAGPDGIRKVSE